MIYGSALYQERNAILQSQKNVLFRAFGIWHSRTKVMFGRLLHLELAHFIFSLCQLYDFIPLISDLNTFKFGEEECRRLCKQSKLEKWTGRASTVSFRSLGFLFFFFHERYGSKIHGEMVAIPSH